MRQKGSVLMLILWVLIVLAVFSVAVSFQASSDTRLARHETDKIKTTYLTRAGIIKMLAEIVRDANSYDSLNEDWNRSRKDPKTLTIRNDKIFYGASDESARLNLNSRSLTGRQLVALGIEESLAEELIRYKSKKGDKGFEFLEELFLVKGMTRQIYADIENFITIYRDESAVVNINTAASRVLEAILIDHSVVQDILEYRKGPDEKQGTSDDGVFRQPADMSVIKGIDPGLFSVSSDVFRIWAQALISEDDDAAVSIEAVVSRSGKTYNWKEF